MEDKKAVNKGIFEAEVLSNQQIRQCYYRLNLQFDAKGSRLFQNVTPGQFLELDLSRVSLPDASMIPAHLRDTAVKQILLRRPFSFSDVIVTPLSEGPCVKVEIMYCVLGPATVRMMSLKSGDRISVLGPLGNGFSIPQGLKQAVLLAGGMGSPPVLHLASHLKRHHPGCEITAFVGAKSCESLPFSVRIGDHKGLVLEEFEMLQVPSHIATDDGSAGYHGFVTDKVRHWLEDQSVAPDSGAVFACGPEPMLAGTARLANDFNLPCQISMERMMACGIGLCQSCAVEIKSDAGDTKYRLCCKDGPVFDANDVLFHKA
ncbi:MAG: dihydroorotate dehydrogenase electron transfer subunit [Phycisphaerae bacterium]|nr:dihydroorotate dehydrogenase electron transfer subunit [Phycisphaerae bacterium]